MKPAVLSTKGTHSEQTYEIFKALIDARKIFETKLEQFSTNIKYVSLLFVIFSNALVIRFQHRILHINVGECICVCMSVYVCLIL